MAVQLHDDRGLISKPIRAFSAIFLSTLVVPLLIWGRGPGQEPTKRDAQAPSMTTGSDYVGSDTCITCHADQGKHFQSTIMGKAFAHPRTDLEKLGCEACHGPGRAHRSEEHTSELQSHSDLVCRLLLEKKNSSPGMSLSVCAEDLT